MFKTTAYALLVLFLAATCLQHSAYGQITDGLVNSSSGSGWREISPQNLGTYKYGGPGYWYNPEELYTRPGQYLIFDIGITPFLRVEASFDNGPWQTVQDCSSSPCTGFVLIGHPWMQAGSHTLTVRWLDVAAQWDTPREYNVFVVPTAQKAYRDDFGNTMTLWEGGNGKIDNLLVVIEGFDPTNDNFPEKYYSKGQLFFEDLLDLDQDVLVFNFASGGIDMIQNSSHLEDALRYLTSIRYGSNKLKVTGVSMGGVIARYALAKAEADGSSLDVSHFVSVDSPQDGAVIDRDLQDFIELNLGDSESLQSVAAKQLLRYNTYDPSGTYHNAFYSQLRSINGDGYPHQTQNIGVAFSPDSPNPGNGLWLHVEVFLAEWKEESFYITNGSGIDLPGSFLPESNTQIWGREWGVPYELIRYQNPTFIPHASALDKDIHGNSRFDVTINSATHGFHDEIPVDIIDPLLSALNLAQPLSVSISGPSSLNVGQEGTWTASSSGGQSPYSYRWDYQLLCGGLIDLQGSGDPQPQDVDCDRWHYGGSGSSFSRTTNGDATLQIKLTVTDAEDTTETVYKMVTVGSGGGLYAVHKQADGRVLEEQVLTAVPEAYALEGNYPNPFNPQTAIRFALPEASDVSLVVYDVMGREVATLVEGRLSAGSHQVQFGASALPSGTYLYRLTAGGFTDTRRMTVVK